LGRVEEKTGEGKTWCDLAGWPDDPVANPLTFIFIFFFFTKTTSFWFFKKRTDPIKTRWPGQNPEPGSWTGLATRPSLKTMLPNIFFIIYFIL
jgi:hypothetical protein